MHFLVIALLSILAGTLLLVKFKKEEAGKFYKFIAWFFIVVGFALFALAVAGGICKAAHHGCCGSDCKQEMMIHKEIYMKDFKHNGNDEMGCAKQPCCKSHRMMDKECVRHVAGDSLQVEVTVKE